MNMKSIALLAVVPSLFGCASTTVKTYSADFKVYPVETKGLGTKHTTPDGEIYIVPQMYRYECTLKETVHSEGKEPVTKVVSSPFVITGSAAQVGIVEKDTINGSMFEAEKIESDSEVQFLLKSTFKRDDSDPVVCSQTITITK
jgi:uncharacterized protein YpuA (DUF1002 family)